MPLPPRLTALLTTGLTGVAAAQAPLLIEYRDKPPYTYTVDGKPAGFLMERTTQVLRRAGIDARYAEVPIRRTMLNLQANTAAMCSPGLYKTAEREAFARYSLPIHRDRPHAVLAHTSVGARIRRQPSIARLFADTQLQPGQVDGVSYGAQLDQWLASTPKPPLRAQLSPLQLVRMVAAHRVDYMLIDQEDLGWLRRDPELAELPVTHIEFTDMPRGELRYIACSQQVAPQTMERINQAIRELPESSSD